MAYIMIELRRKLRKFDPEVFLNVKETVLFYKLLSMQTQATKCNTVKSFRQPQNTTFLKNQIIAYFYTNAVSDRVPAALITEENTTRWFRMDTPLVQYVLKNMLSPIQ